MNYVVCKRIDNSTITFYYNEYDRVHDTDTVYGTYTPWTKEQYKRLIPYAMISSNDDTYRSSDDITDIVVTMDKINSGVGMSVYRYVVPFGTKIGTLIQYGVPPGGLDVAEITYCAIQYYDTYECSDTDTICDMVVESLNTEVTLYQKSYVCDIIKHIHKYMHNMDIVGTVCGVSVGQYSSSVLVSTL